MPNCGCPEGYLPFTWQEGTTRTRISTNLGIPEEDLEFLQDDTGNTIFIDVSDQGCGFDIVPSPGYLLCVKNVGIVNYDSSRSTLATSLNIALFTELLQLMNYAELLGLAARASLETINDGIVTEYLENEGFLYYELIDDILNLACRYNYPANGELSIAFNRITNGGILTCEYFREWGNYVARIARVSSREEIDGLISILHSLAAWVENNAESEITADAILSSLITSEQIAEYEDIRAQNDRFAELMEETKAILDAWNKEAENVLITNLEAYLPYMNNVIAGVWVGHIVATFETYTRNMRNRHNLLIELEGAFERISWLQLSDDERMDLAEREFLLENFTQYGIPYDENVLRVDIALPRDQFDRLALNYITEALQTNSALRETLFNANLLGYSNHIESNLPPDQRESNQTQSNINWQAEGAIPEASDVTASTVLANLSNDITVDPYDTEQVYAGVQMAADVAFFVLGFLPVVGTFLDIVDLVKDLVEGDYVGAALATLLMPLNIDDLATIGHGIEGLLSEADDLIARGSDDLIEYAEQVSTARRALADYESAIETLTQQGDKLTSAERQVDDLLYVNGSFANDFFTTARPRPLAGEVLPDSTMNFDINSCAAGCEWMLINSDNPEVQRILGQRNPIMVPLWNEATDPASLSMRTSGSLLNIENDLSFLYRNNYDQPPIIYSGAVSMEEIVHSLDNGVPVVMRVSSDPSIPSGTLGLEEHAVIVDFIYETLDENGNVIRREFAVRDPDFGTVGSGAYYVDYDEFIQYTGVSPSGRRLEGIPNANSIPYHGALILGMPYSSIPPELLK